MVLWVVGGGGVKELKMAQNYKKIVCLTPYLRNRTSGDCGFWYTCVKWWYLQQFFEILIFGFLVGARGRGKSAKNDP